MRKSSKQALTIRNIRREQNKLAQQLHELREVSQDWREGSNARFMAKIAEVKATKEKIIKLEALMVFDTSEGK